MVRLLRLDWLNTDHNSPHLLITQTGVTPHLLRWGNLIMLRRRAVVTRWTGDTWTCSTCLASGFIVRLFSQFQMFVVWGWAEPSRRWWDRRNNPSVRRMTNDNLNIEAGLRRTCPIKSQRAPVTTARYFTWPPHSSQPGPAASTSNDALNASICS